MSVFSDLTGSQLVALVDDFLADVSCEINIGSEIVEEVRTVADACFFERSISVHEFIQQATTSLRCYPNLVRKLNVFLRVSGESLEIVVNNISTTDLVVIHGPSGGQIYSVSDAIPVPIISNTTALRALLENDSVELDFADATYSSSACAVAELLQQELNCSSLDAVHRTKCLRHLRRLALQKGILPPSFFLHDVIRDGLHPVSGGGFADVYKGKLNGDVVCLKALRFFVERSEMAQKLLNDCCREALVWKQLNHPNVLPFLGVNVELFAPSFCLVSPWMSNGNLMQFLDRHPDFDRRSAITDIAAAMQYLHEYSPSIVHADIRGANVLVQDNLRCCLADFGLSSMAASLSLRASSTGDSKGSIRWLAPEFFVSSGDRNHLKSTSRDIYAFACTILEVYTGHHPFLEHKIDPPVIHDVLAGQRPPRPPELNDDLWTLTQACWQQDPDRRPSARKVMRFLQQKDYLDMRSIGTLQILNPESTSNMSPTRDRNPQRLPPAIPTPTINAENSQVVNVARRSRSFWNFARLYGRNNQPAKAVFGVPLQDSLSVAQISNLPAVIFRTIQYLEAGKGKQTEDIYSVKGSYTVINGLKARFNAEGDVNLMSNGYWDPHVVADLLKSFLRELPDSILTHELHPDFSSVLGIVDPEQRVIQLSRLVTTLPSANYNLLRALIAHLSVIVENASTNKMTMRQIGIVLGPTVGISAGLLSLMMVQFDRIFGTSTQEGIPEEAATEATSQVSTPLTRLSAFDGHIDSEPDRESASAGSSGRSETDGESELTRMVGYLTATGSEDWPVVLDLCERASLSDSNAKEVVRALRREFKYGEPSTQLSAASLWAITLSNSTETFISQSTAGTFLETLEDLLTSPDTSPVVKERVMVVVCAAASASGDTKDSAFGRLWQKVKPHFKPGEGFPDNNIERLFQQCKIAQGNARVLAQALAGAQTLNDLQNGARAGIIMEFHATCVSSQAIICEQIEVAGLAAELSRSMKHRERLPIHGRIQTISTDSNQPSADEDPDTPFEMTIEEKLLAELLAVNTELLEVLGQYAHLEELGVQRET